MSGFEKWSGVPGLGGKEGGMDCGDGECTVLLGFDRRVLFRWRTGGFIKMEVKTLLVLSRAIFNLFEVDGLLGCTMVRDVEMDRCV